MQLRFDAVFYYVRDLDRAIAFYADILALPLRSRDVVARLDVDGVLLELVPSADEARLTGHGNARLCFAVEDVHQAAAALRAKGVQVGDVLRVENGLLAPFSDPDGNELVLWQYAES